MLGEWGWPQKGLPDAAWWGFLRTRVGTFTTSHSLASLAGTGDRTLCLHHLLPLPSLLQPGWELGRLATSADDAIWRAQSPHTPVSHSVSTPPPTAHPTLWLALRRSSIHTLPSVPTRQHPSGLHHCRSAGRARLLPTAPGFSQRHGTPGPLSPPPSVRTVSFLSLPLRPPWECKYTVTLKVPILALSPYATSV